MATPTSAVSDRAVSHLRTVVPVLWGSAVAGLLTAVTLPVEVADLLGSEHAATAVTAVAVGTWYVAWRWVEPRLPDWLTCVVLGSARTPHYAHGTPDPLQDPSPRGTECAPASRTVDTLHSGTNIGAPTGAPVWTASE